MPDEHLSGLESLLQVATRIAKAAPTGRVLIARVAATIDPAWLEGDDGERIRAVLNDARVWATAPLPAATVEAILRDAWDAPASDELDDLDFEPVASTPTAQVHRGVRDGAPVAVKVLRPGIGAAVRRDLILLETLLAPLTTAMPWFDGPALVREARERILDELDLEHEAELQRRVARALRRHPALTAPSPVTSLAREQVLVSEWLEGTPLRMIAEPAQRDQAAARLVGFVLGGVRTGILHAGTVPDDVLLTRDGRLAVLDFGAAHALSATDGATALALLDALAQGDGGGFGAALDGLGLLAANRGPAALEFAQVVLGELGGEAPARLDSAALAAAGDRFSAHRGAARELLSDARLPVTRLWPLRGLLELLATLVQLEATAPWRELAALALRDGWDAVS